MLCCAAHNHLHGLHKTLTKYLALIAMRDQVTPDILLAIKQACEYPPAPSVALVVKQKIWLQSDSLVLCCSSGLRHLHGHTSVCKPLTHFFSLEMRCYLLYKSSPHCRTSLVKGSFSAVFFFFF